MYIHTPLITSSDCEGAGELFTVDAPNSGENDQKGDSSQHFFKTPAFLTVSGQLNLETYCVGLGDVYTFSPTFRAENSHTKRHLSEFWMVEPELAFGDLTDCINLSEDCLKSVCQYLMTHNLKDLEF